MHGLLARQPHEAQAGRQAGAEPHDAAAELLLARARERQAEGARRRRELVGERGVALAAPLLRVEPAVHRLEHRVREALRHLARGRGAHGEDVLQRDVERAAVLARARHERAHLPQQQRVVEEAVEVLREVEGHLDARLAVEVAERLRHRGVVGRRLERVHVLVVPVALAAQRVERHHLLLRAPRAQPLARLALVANAAQLRRALLGDHAARHDAQRHARQRREDAEEAVRAHVSHLRRGGVDAAVLGVEREQVGHQDDLVRHAVRLHLHAVQQHRDELAVGAVGEQRLREAEVEARAPGLGGGVEELDLARPVAQVPDAPARPLLDGVGAKGGGVGPLVRQPAAAVPRRAALQPLGDLVERPRLDDVVHAVRPPAVGRRRLRRRRRQRLGRLHDRHVPVRPRGEVRRRLGQLVVAQRLRDGRLRVAVDQRRHLGGELREVAVAGVGGGLLEQRLQLARLRHHGGDARGGRGGRRRAR